MGSIRKLFDIKRFFLLLSSLVLALSCQSLQVNSTMEKALKLKETAKYYYEKEEYNQSSRYAEDALKQFNKINSLKVNFHPDWSIENHIEECEHIIASCFEKQNIFTANFLENPSEINVQIKHKAVLVNVLLNKKETAKFLLDTGASKTLLAPEVAKKLEMNFEETAPRITLSLIGGKKIKVPIVNLNEIQVGAAVAKNLTIGISIIDDEISYFDGILGYDFLQHYKLTVDREKGLLTLVSQRKSKPKK